MDFYQAAFLVLISGCVFMSYKEYQNQKISPAERKPLLQDGNTTNEASVAKTDPKATAEANKFNRLFLTVYALVMASDWLQGPYVYSLYKDQFGLKEELVAALFTTGFLSGGVSGYFVGQFADKYGRKMACLVFCVTYSVACFSTLFPNLYALFFGRVFGGLSTSLMYSAFESWMVTEYHKRQIDKAGMSLSSMFGYMATLNSIVAILSGVFSEWLVEVTGTKRSPFMASAGLLAISFCIILISWDENYGDSHREKDAKAPTQSAIKTVFTDKRILTIGLASCFFEGSMYLFVFFWTPALKAAQAHQPSGGKDLPLGLIFACFMACVMLGSLLFNLLVSKHQLVSHSRLLTITFLAASSALLVPPFIQTTTPTFVSFCLFEICVGIYFPSIGYLKGKHIDDGIRARVYGMLRIPLNVFVVVALSLVKEGDGYRNAVFGICSAMLVGMATVFGWVVSG